MVNNDLISIIMPVYNTDKYLAEAINSVLNQTYQNFELVIVDDHSTDNSSKIINSFKSEKIKYTRLDRNTGAANARNVGIMQSIGNIICFIDSDDIWDENKLKKQYEFMTSNKYAFCYCKYKKMNENGITKEIKYKYNHKITYKDLLNNTEIGTSTVMLNTKLISKELIKMNHYNSCEDTATWLRITKQGFDAYILPEYLAIHRVRRGSLSYNKFKNAINMFKIYRKQEKKSIVEATKLFINYAVNALNKRL